jgi:parallel beta-helix repeat protein
MKRMFHLLALLTVLLIFSTSAYATTRYVGTQSGDYTTIQLAVNASVGGDIVLVRAGTYAKFAIPAGKNGLIIQAADATNKPIIDGANATLPAIGITISSDDVEIRNLKIRNFNNSYYASNFDANDLSNYGGAAIYSTFNKTNLTIEKNEISNCNWGVYLSEPVNCSLFSNTISNITRWPDALTSTGGVGIMVISFGSRIEGNVIGDSLINEGNLGNTITGCQRYGIWMGCMNSNISADISYIKFNTITNSHNSDKSAFAIGISNVTGIVNIAKNVLKEISINIQNGFITGANDQGLFIEANVNDHSCEDVVVHHNDFRNTDSVKGVEIKSGIYFSGEKLYDIWRDLYNNFDETSLGDKSDVNSTDARGTRGTCAFMDDAKSIELSYDGTSLQTAYRFIRNRIDLAIILDAYSSNGMKVEVLPGTYFMSSFTIGDNLYGTTNLTLEGVGMPYPKMRFGLSDPLITVLPNSSYLTMHHFEVEPYVLTQDATNSFIKIGSQHCTFYDNIFTCRTFYASDLTNFFVVPNESGYDPGALMIDKNIFQSYAPATGTTQFKGLYTAIVLGEFATAENIDIFDNLFSGRIYEGIIVSDNAGWGTNIYCNSFVTKSVAINAPMTTTDMIRVSNENGISNVYIFDNTFDFINNSPSSADLQKAILLNAGPGGEPTPPDGGSTIPFQGTDGINVYNNRFNQAQTAILVYQALGVDIYNNWLAGVYNLDESTQLHVAINNMDVTNTLKAENNWWNCPDGPNGTYQSTPDLICPNRTGYLGLVDYSPWLTSDDAASSSCGNPFVTIQPGFDPVQPSKSIPNLVIK